MSLARLIDLELQWLHRTELGALTAYTQRRITTAQASAFAEDCNARMRRLVLERLECQRQGRG